MILKFIKKKNTSTGVFLFYSLVGRKDKTCEKVAEKINAVSIKKTPQQVFSILLFGRKKG